MGARLHDYDVSAVYLVGRRFVDAQLCGLCYLHAMSRNQDHHNGWTVKGLATENSICVPARAGSIVVFSSLTPHMTSANITDGVRKAYICQYARDGVVAVDSEDGTKATRTTRPASNEDRQYFVLQGGNPVPPPPMPAT